MLLENVKFLTLSNKSRIENSLNPHNFEIVNAVIRELEVDVLIHRSPPATIIPALTVLNPIEPAISHEPELEIAPSIEARTCKAKIPFLACLQYENLKESENIIQELIKSTADTERYGVDVECLGFPTEYIDDIDVQQCQVLAELSEWRMEMVRELSMFGSESITLADQEFGRNGSDTV